VNLFFFLLLIERSRRAFTILVNFGIMFSSQTLHPNYPIIKKKKFETVVNKQILRSKKQSYTVVPFTVAKTSFNWGQEAFRSLSWVVFPLAPFYSEKKKSHRENCLGNKLDYEFTSKESWNPFNK
jgi:hypothetical protein